MKKSKIKTAKPPRTGNKPDPNHYPEGWDRNRVEAVIAHYEQQTDEQAVAEDEAQYNAVDSTMMQIPLKLVPAVQKLLAKQRG